MNATVREWVDKAEADFAMAQHNLSTAPHPNYDGVCFHAQQCIEKLIKGLMIHLNIDPPRTHNLVWLDELLRPACSRWNPNAADLHYLTQAGSAFRYPGAIAERQDAEYAMQLCSSLREKLKAVLAGAPELPLGD